MNFEETLFAAEKLGISKQLITTWFPRSKFVQAVLSNNSLSITRQAKPFYGMAFGPAPEIDSRWNEFSIARSTSKELTNSFKDTGPWDIYGIATKPFDLDYKIIKDSKYIDSFIESHAPNSSVKSDSKEVVAWVGIEDVALGAICKWESGEHVLASIVVAVDERGKGYGKKVTKALITAADKAQIKYLSLGVIADNAAAIATYESLGFTQLAQFNSFSSI